jgi:hypothetical protein
MDPNFSPHNSECSDIALCGEYEILYLYLIGKHEIRFISQDLAGIETLFLPASNPPPGFQLIQHIQALLAYRFSLTLAIYSPYLLVSSFLEVNIGYEIRCRSLEESENHLDYPLSDYGNLREGMPDDYLGSEGESGSGSGSKGDSGVLTASVVATSTALGVLTSASSSSSAPTMTGSGGGSDDLEAALTSILHEDEIIS